LADEPPEKTPLDEGLLLSDSSDLMNFNQVQCNPYPEFENYQLMKSEHPEIKIEENKSEKKGFFAKANAFWDKTVSKINETTAKISEKFDNSDVGIKIKKTGDKAFKVVKHGANYVVVKSQPTVDKIKEKTKPTIDKIKEKTKPTYDKIVEKTNKGIDYMQKKTNAGIGIIRDKSEKVWNDITKKDKEKDHIVLEENLIQKQYHNNDSHYSQAHINSIPAGKSEDINNFNNSTPGMQFINDSHLSKVSQIPAQSYVHIEPNYAKKEDANFTILEHQQTQEPNFPDLHDIKEEELRKSQMSNNNPYPQFK
jgi:hypothetical protein